MMMKVNVCLTSGIHPTCLCDDEDECMLNIGHTSNVMMMMMMINVVVNRELGRDYIHLLSNNSEVVRSHVHFLQCD